MEEGLRGHEVVIVGATGRTPRGWWGDETVGLVLHGGVFDERRPELLPVRVPLRSAALGSVVGEVVIPEVMDVGVRATNLRLRPRVDRAPSAQAALAAAEGNGDGPSTSPSTGTGTGTGTCPVAAVDIGDAHAAKERGSALSELRQASSGERLHVEREGALQWIDELRPCVHHVRPPPRPPKLCRGHAQTRASQVPFMLAMRVQAGALWIGSLTLSVPLTFDLACSRPSPLRPLPPAPHPTARPLGLRSCSAARCTSRSSIYGVAPPRRASSHAVASSICSSACNR